MQNTPCANARAYAAASMGDGSGYHGYAEWYYQQDWLTKAVIFHDTRGGPHFNSQKRSIEKGWEQVTFWIKADVCCCRNSPFRIEIGTAIDRYNQLFWVYTPGPKQLPKYTAPKCFTEAPGK
jgi:hypothetical protein